MAKKKVVLCIVGILVFVTFYSYNQKIKTIEEYEISSAFGNDIEKIFEGQINYSIPYSLYNSQNSDEDKAFMTKGIAGSIGQTRENRELKSGKSSIIGLQKLIVIGEEQARFGIKPIVNILFANPKMNDRSLFVVCKGKAEDVLNFNIKGYESSADFIEGMMKRLNKSDFFLNEYSLLNAYVGLSTEGCNLVLPYLEIVNKELEISEMAVFKEDKMLRKLNLEESTTMNMLRGNKSRGILTVVIEKDKTVSYSAQVKRSVKCEKQDGKYMFHIKVDCLANVISSKDYNVLNIDKNKELEETIKKDLQHRFLAFIDKMQNQYKLDMLQLGFIAASKYGKDTGVDWNKEVSNGKINIDVKVKVQENKRGE